MELKQLRYFLAVADELSFSAAATRLNMSQPPLSLQIQKLEEEVGVPLFIRGKRKIVLTPAGEAMVLSARRLMEDQARIPDDVRKAALGEAGRLIVGTTDDFLHDGLPEALCILHHRRPSVLVETTIGLSADLARAVSQRRIDVAFICPPIGLPRDLLEFKELSATPLEFLIQEGHAFARSHTPTLEEIWQQPFIWPGDMQQTGFMLQLLKIVRKMNSFPKIVHRTSCIDLIKHMVRSGVGIAPISKHSIGPTPGVTRIPVDGVCVDRAAIWRKDSPSELVADLVPLVSRYITSSRPR